MRTDFLIVGQGVAGSLLAWFLLHAGKSVVVVDDGHKHAASITSLGLINPVIGVRLRGSLSLVVFFYTFLVVLGGILLTYNGERFARSQPLFVGIMLLWLSSLLTAGGIGMLYARVARN